MFSTSMLNVECIVSAVVSLHINFALDWHGLSFTWKFTNERKLVAGTAIAIDLGPKSNPLHFNLCVLIDNVNY